MARSTSTLSIMDKMKREDESKAPLDASGGESMKSPRPSESPRSDGSARGMKRSPRLEKTKSSEKEFAEQLKDGMPRRKSSGGFVILRRTSEDKAAKEAPTTPASAVKM